MVFASGVARGGLFVPRDSTRRERPHRGAGDSRERDRDRDRDRDHCFPGKILRLCSRRRCFGPCFLYVHVFVFRCFCLLRRLLCFHRHCLGPLCVSSVHTEFCCSFVSCGDPGLCTRIPPRVLEVQTTRARYSPSSTSMLGDESFWAREDLFWLSSTAIRRMLFIRYECTYFLFLGFFA